MPQNELIWSRDPQISMPRHVGVLKRQVTKSAEMRPHFHCDALRLCIRLATFQCSVHADGLITEPHILLSSSCY